MSSVPRTNLASRKLRRGEIDILASILSEAREDAGKTRIMYRCNLNYARLQAYLKVLLGMGLLTPRSETDSNAPNHFKTTAKGLEFLDAYSTLKALMT